MQITIRRDGIYHKAQGGALDMLLCKFGFHRFRYWPMAQSYYVAFPCDADMVCRNCVKCGWMELTHDGRTWQGRI
jgi:hypothetical protein